MLNTFLKYFFKNIMNYFITDNQEHKGNTYPLTKISESKYIEGYWFQKNNINYPIPKCGSVPVSKLFIQKLQKVMKSDLVKEKVYLGFSRCRLCNQPNGGSEYSIMDDNGIEFIFPSGVLHYYDVHHVQPSSEFVNVIMKLEL